MAKQDYDRFSQPLGACGLNNVYCRSCENAVVKGEYTLLQPNLSYCSAYKNKPNNVFEHNARCEKYVRLTSRVLTNKELFGDLLK